MIPENHEIWRALGFSPRVHETTRVGLLMAGFALVLAPAFTLFTKRFFYDAHVSVRGRRMTISARSASFIEELRGANAREGR